jgi:hypothetical protein
MHGRWQVADMAAGSRGVGGALPVPVGCWLLAVGSWANWGVRFLVVWIPQLSALGGRK